MKQSHRFLEVFNISGEDPLEQEEEQWPCIDLWQPQPCLGQTQQLPMGHESSLHPARLHGTVVGGSLLQIHRGSCGATCPCWCLNEVLVTEIYFEISRCIVTFSYCLRLCFIGSIADVEPECIAVWLPNNYLSFTASQVLIWFELCELNNISLWQQWGSFVGSYRSLEWEKLQRSLFINLTSEW